MSQAETLHARYRSHVADLTGALDANDANAFRAAFERLREQLNVEFNPELRRLTASAQNALRRFREHARIDALASHEVPDARKRLAHVVKLTDEAAHRTLDLVEQSGPLVDQTARDAAQLLEELRSRGQNELAAPWEQRTAGFLQRAVEDADRVRGLLSQMLLAQGYQDLTGQIIRGVIELVGELESVLGQLVALANGEDTRRMPALRMTLDPETVSAGSGPQIPGISTGEAFGDQQDVDALLARMGDL
jgi:chemotaxis protein CheZ